MKTLFADYFHPLTVFLNIALILGFSMAAFNPAFIILSLIIALFQGVVFLGVKKTIKTLAFSLPLLLVVAIFNPIVSKRGETILFEVFSESFTLESLLYGVFSGTMLITILLLFTVYSRLVPTEKFMFLFSRLAPAFSMAVTMTQRFIPLFAKRFRFIKSTQKTMTSKESGKLRGALNENSMLLSWSMEEGLETADSMKARGYGAAKRTQFSPYKFTAKDFVILIFTLLLGASAIVFYAISPKAEFYPDFVVPISLFTYLSLFSFALLGILLPTIEIYKNITFKIREQKII